MFTGIVKTVAKVIQIEKQGSMTQGSKIQAPMLQGAVLRYALELPKDYAYGLEIGASVSIDGVCQTVVKIEGNIVWFEAIEETIIRTTFKTLHVDQSVNVERSAKIGDEIGGHLLSGHVYGTASLSTIEKNIFTFQCQKDWMRYLFSKGFIAIDGMSLTVVDVDDAAATFTIHAIPETLKKTTLGARKVGDLVNLEFDALTQAAVETAERLFKKQN